LNNTLWTRRNLLHVGVKGCATCAAISLGLTSSRAAAATEIDGKGYVLRFIGNQREAMMMGKRAATLDLRTLKGRPHLYGLGPLEWLSGEVTIADQRPSLTRLGPDQKLQVTESYDAVCRSLCGRKFLPGTWCRSPLGWTPSGNWRHSSAKPAGAMA
jgi:hypothetical protein